jgi:hypothetical protein
MESLNLQKNLKKFTLQVGLMEKNQSSHSVELESVRVILGLS